MPVEILVRGEGEASALPDRAVIHVMVEGEGSSQEDAYAKAGMPPAASTRCSSVT